MAERSAPLSLWIAATALLSAQTYVAGPQVLTVFSGIDDSDQPYALYLPKSYDPARRYPLVVSLHGAQSNHRLNLRRVFGRGNLPGETDSEATRRFPTLREVDYMVACPLARGTMGYQGLPENDVYDVLADVRKRFNIDEDRIYLTGLSMGGGGALWLGLTRPDLWAAVAAVCPSVRPGTAELAPNALNLPVRLFHGSADPTVPVESSRQWHKRLLEEQVDVDYIEYPGARHNSWDLAYKDAAIFDWFGKYRRNRFPARVRFVSAAYRYNSAYWVRLDALTPGTPAAIDARFTAPNRVEISTAALRGFTLTPGGHPSFSASKPLELAIDGARHTARAGGEFSFQRTPGGWRAGAYVHKAGEKRPGAEGPIGAAVAGRHVYIYGTADNPPAAELERRRQEAASAAEWSTPRSRLHLTLRAVAANQAQESDLAGSNLVLLGTKETNEVIRRFAPQLPLELNAGAADYGLVFVYPAGGRYLVVNSGLPFWTGAEYTSRVTRNYAGRNIVLGSFGDFILFKGSLEHVVAEGRFDDNWRVPSDLAARLKASGAVEVKP